MTEKILILDFGSQYTQLIARAVREANVYCEIIPYHKPFEFEPGLKGIILSGSPFSVNEEKAPDVNVQDFITKVPVLGVCYGAQLTAKRFGGRVEKSNKREYGRAMLHKQKEDILFNNVAEESQVWMSHADTILEMPEGFELLATTESIPVAAFKKSSNGITTHQFPLYGVQFHPEVYHSKEGKKILNNFLVNICGCSQDWTPAHFITDTVEALKKQIGNRKVIMALSGGVDSTVAATLIHRAIGDRLYGIFVDNGVLRKNEFESVLTTYDKIGLKVKGIDARQRFYNGLAGKTEPEEKRKTLDDYKRVAEDFNRIGESAKKVNLRFAYHNHDYSFKMVDGQFPQEVMMQIADPALVDFEMDMYWVHAAGEDIETWLKKYKGRFKLCHIKDFSSKPIEDNGKNSVDLGRGVIDWPKVLKTANECGMEHYIVEQEAYPYGSPLEAVKADAIYMKSLAK